MLVTYLLPIPLKNGVASQSHLTKLLEQTIRSVCEQSTPNWQLIVITHSKHHHTIKSILNVMGALLDEPPVKGSEITSNHKIGLLVQDFRNKAQSLNYGLPYAQGRFITTLEIGNQIASHCTFEITKVAMEHKAVRMIYPNHDSINLNGKRSKPFFKPSFSPDLLYCQFYFGDLVFFHRTLLSKAGAWDEQFDWAHSYDMVLRCVDLVFAQKNCALLSLRDQGPIYHTTQFLSHVTTNYLGAKLAQNKSKALTHKNKISHEEFLVLQKNIGNQAKIEKIDVRLFRPLWNLKKSWPLISILIPTHNGFEILKACIQSVLQKSSYPNYEILIIDNRTSDIKTLSYMKQLSQDNSNIRVLRYNKPFNYAAMMNYAAALAKGSLLCLLNNDTELLTADWLQIMASHALRQHTGAVGAMLYYPDGTIQHAGTIVGLNGAADHAFKGVKKTQKNDYYQYLSSIRNPKAVTAAALMIQKTLFNQIGGFDSKKLKVAFNDVDLCLKLLEVGYFNVWLPHVELVHHESKSRKQDTSPHLHKVAQENFEFKVINKRYNLNNYYHTMYD